MPKFKVKKKFKFGETIFKVGEILYISDADLEKEVANGKHPIQGTWLSGALNHGRRLDEVADAELIADDEAKIKKAKIKKGET